jgi:hypothetical protein
MKWTRMIALLSLCLLGFCLLGFASPLFAEAPAAPATQPAGWMEPGKELVRYHAKGVQIYVATAGADGTLAWKFKAPEAELTDDAGKSAGKHFAGPTWEAADGSKVVGQKPSARPSPNPQSVPELQLSAKSHDGAGVFATVAMIERLNTRGGVAPAMEATVKAGDEIRIPYTADYVFFDGK